jgi:hypothetical protein
MGLLVINALVLTAEAVTMLIADDNDGDDNDDGVAVIGGASLPAGGKKLQNQQFMQNFGHFCEKLLVLAPIT